MPTLDIIELTIETQKLWSKFRLQQQLASQIPSEFWEFPKVALAQLKL
jgi:hypothetical protein